MAAPDPETTRTWRLGVPGGSRFHVLVAGGGIAALEAMLALRQHLGGRVAITMLAPEPELVYRPRATSGALGLGEVRRLPLGEVAADLRLGHVRERLARVEPGERIAVTERGERLAYDALLVATGAHREPALPGALTHDGPDAGDGVAALLGQIKGGELDRIAFAAPRWVPRPLALYELALLIARWPERPGALHLAIYSATDRPLAPLGERAADGVAQLLAFNGVELHAAAPARFDRTHARLHFEDGGFVRADRVISLPRLAAAAIAGLPQGPLGFIETDRHMRVAGAERVWAAGDVTSFPVKQAGLAAHQGETAAGAIARLVRPDFAAEAFRPVLRAAMLTGGTPREALAGGEGDAPLWWPPGGIAGRRLVPYLAEAARRGRCSPQAEAALVAG